MKRLLLCLAILFTLPAQAKEDLYGDKIPFITAKYCKDFLSELHAAATIKEGLQALAGVSTAKRLEICTEELAMNWEKYSEAQRKEPKELLTPNDPLFYKNLDPEEKAKAILGYSKSANYGFMIFDLQNFTVKITEEGHLLVSISGKPLNFSTLDTVLKLTPSELKELSKYEFPLSEIKEYGEKWKRTLKVSLSNEEYKVKRLLSRYSAFLKDEERSMNFQGFCQVYEQEQKDDQKALLEVKRNQRAQDWEIATQWGLTEGQIQGLREYTDSYYKIINPKLRKPETMTEGEKYFVKVSNRALEKAPSFKGKVLRFADLPEQALAEHQKGKVVTYASFTSTSKNPKWDWEGSQKFLIFSAEKGKTIQRISRVPGEEEVLFPPNTKFKILKRISPDPTSPRKIYFIMAETDEEGNVIADIPEELKK